MRVSVGGRILEVRSVGRLYVIELIEALPFSVNTIQCEYMHTINRAGSSSRQSDQLSCVWEMICM